MKVVGDGELDFKETFDSLDDGEHVRLIAKMSDSSITTMLCHRKTELDDEIRVSESLFVDQGKDIECSAEAWNSLGQSAKVGLKIPEGSLTDYSNYGDATDTNLSPPIRQ